MLKQFAEELKAAREKAGISLQQVAAKTRIDLKFLKDLENGDFNFLPELYVKAFIKQYSKVVGLDDQEILYKYDRAKDGKTDKDNEEKQRQVKESSEEVKEQKEPAKPKPPEKSPYSYIDENATKKETADAKKKQNPVIIGGSALAAILVFVLVYFLFFNKSSDIIVEEKPFEEVLKDTPKRYVEEKNQQPNESVLVSNLEKFTLTFTDVDSSDSAWVLVIIDDTTQTDFMLLPKISRSVTASKNLKFTLGNSGAIELLFDNNPLEFDKRRGAVRHYKFDKNGLERLYSPPQMNQ